MIRSKYNFVLWLILRAAVLFAAIVFPRLMVLGGLPATDEGFYAFYSQLFHHYLSVHGHLPNWGPLMLYPLTVNWIFGTGWNPIISLRFLDLIISLIAGWLFCELVVKETKDRLIGSAIAFLFLFTMNQPVFIQNGFKNPIFFSYIFLFSALLLVRNENRNSVIKYLLLGCFLAFVVFARETFISFSIFGLTVIFIRNGLKKSLLVGLGAGISSLFLLSWILLSRGGVAPLIESYRNMGKVFSVFDSYNGNLFFENGAIAFKNSWQALLLAVSFVWIFLRKEKCTFRSAVFWGVFLFIPLLEPFFKIAFPYHFSVILPVLGYFLSWIYGRSLRQSKDKIMALSIVIILSLTFGKNIRSLSRCWSVTRSNLIGVFSNKWTNDSILASNYLFISDSIKAVAKPQSSLLVSGFMHALYPLTGLLPNDLNLSDLSSFVIQVGFDERRLKKKLNASGASFLFITNRTDQLGAVGKYEIDRVIKGSEAYEKVFVVPLNAQRSYGSFGGTLYKHKQ